MNTQTFPVLAIDTSGPYLQVGILQAGSNAIVISEDLPKGHAEQLFDRLDRVLGQANLTFKDIARIVVTLGPGSFTGLRIGIAAARGFGVALNIPVIGIPNLVALSLEQGAEPHTILVDAKREQMYEQEFLSAGVPKSAGKLVPVDGREMQTAPKVSIEAMLTFASECDPADWLPNPTYIRAADAKPQTRNLIARQDQVSHQEKAPDGVQ